MTSWDVIHFLFPSYLPVPSAEVQKRGWRGGPREEQWCPGVPLCSCQKYYLVNSAQSSLPEVGQTCFLPYDVSLRNTNCRDFLCSHRKGKETAGKCFTDGKALGISLKRGPPMQMAHYFNIWIFILLKHLFFFLVLFSIINSLTL